MSDSLSRNNYKRILSQLFDVRPMKDSADLKDTGERRPLTGSAAERFGNIAYFIIAC